MVTVTFAPATSHLDTLSEWTPLEAEVIT
jgi:hypothetical protein